MNARARSVLLALAVGDALGLPADYHRSVRTPWVRGALWERTSELDAQQVSHPLLPFTPTLADRNGVVATDDAETASVAARAILDADAADDGATPSSVMFATWHSVHADPQAWMGIAARNAVRVAARGDKPPRTGSDNPARMDDTALAAAVPFGIRFAGNAALAATHAGAYASITNADEGISAARALAAAIATVLGGSPLREGIDAARTELADDAWTRDNLDAARAIVAEARRPFAALPALQRTVAPRTYSFGGVAAETLPLALALAELADGDPEAGIPLALTFARTADSVPALVGALCAATGELSWPEWSAVDELRGILLPATAGWRLSTLADALGGDGDRDDERWRA
ncbi:hypothetical protein GCM10027058_18440 [Microbacterium neimengense]